MWDKEYEDGHWDHCERTPDAHVYACIERYCRNGSVLDLGCGSGNTGNELKVDCYSEYVGVDISDVAVKKAIERSLANGRGGKNHYLTGDIVSFAPPRTYDVILFRESIYYVPLITLRGVLNHYRRFLRDGGALIVDVSTRGTRKGGKIRALIEANYEIIERYSPPDSQDFVLVFR